jgi:hemolysin D
MRPDHFDQRHQRCRQCRKSEPGPAGQQPWTQNLVFPATIRLARSSIAIDGKEVALTPGMAVTVEIKTGQRRAINYLLSPLREVAMQAARDR